MLVDEPFLDDVVAREQRGVRRVEDQKAAILQRAMMIGQRVRRMNQMLDRVAGMDDIEAAGFQRHILDALLDQMRARKPGAGRGDALVGLDSNDMRIWRGVEKSAAKLPRLEPTSSSENSSLKLK